MSPDHAHVCSATKGLRTSRNDQQVHAWRRVLRCAGCSLCREPTYRTVAAHAAANAAGLRRGDIVATMPYGRLLALDVVIVHPWASSYAVGASKIEPDGKAARIAAARNRREFATRGEGAGGFDFGPIAVETGGRLGADALFLLSELCDVAAARNSRLSKAAFVRRTLTDLACPLCRGNASVYAGSMSRLLRVDESAMPVVEIVAIEEERACVCRRGWCFFFGFLSCRSTCSTCPVRPQCKVLLASRPSARVRRTVKKNQ